MIPKGYKFRPKNPRPLFAALSQCVMEFAKVGVKPSQVQELTVAADVFDRLHAEVMQMNGTFGEGEVIMDIIGIRIKRGA